MAFEIIFVLIIVALIALCTYFLLSLMGLSKKLEELLHDKTSQSVRYGFLTEQWIPFSEKFPYNAENFRFIGKPIDGVCFEENKIVFVEIKSNKSKLSESQKKVRKLVEEKKIEWLELRAE
jgi:predicted Holliday junction resolvase-like endonuclease